MLSLIHAPATDISEVTEELIQAILDDASEHLELRLAAIERDFRNRLDQTREYLARRTRERIKELIDGEELELRRKKKQPVKVNWRVPNGQYPPDDPRRNDLTLEQ